MNCVTVKRKQVLSRFIAWQYLFAGTTIAFPLLSTSFSFVPPHALHKQYLQNQYYTNLQKAVVVLFVSEKYYVLCKKNTHRKKERKKDHTP